MEGYTHIIWDFNGTLYDDVGVCLSCARRLMRAHGLQPLASLDDYRSLFGFPIIDYYRRMGFDFSVTPYGELAEKWIAYYHEESATAGLAPRAEEVLERIRARNLSQLVLSATEYEMLERQVQALGIRDYFDELLGLSDIQAHGKAAIGRAWKERHPNARPLLIGDTDHDAAVAREMGADCILIAAGHQSKHTLAACKPLYVLDELSQLLTFF